MREPSAVTRLRRKYRVVAPELDERRRRQWAAAEAREVGYGGVSAVARATGLARSTIHAGLRDVRASRRQRERAAARVRRAGAGRRPLTTSDPALLTALWALIEPTVRGDPESPLRWTCKSTGQLADELTQQRHPVSPRTVATLLKGAGYSLQANQKTREGASHPDRDAQFRYLAGLITKCHQHDMTGGTSGSNRSALRIVSGDVVSAASRRLCSCAQKPHPRLDSRRRTRPFRCIRASRACLEWHSRLPRHLLKPCRGEMKQVFTEKALEAVLAAAQRPPSNEDSLPVVGLHSAV